VYFCSLRSVSGNRRYAFVAKSHSILEKLGIRYSVKDKIVAVKMHLGFQNVIFSMPNDYEIEPLKVIGRDVMPAITKLGNPIE
jgi:hypothetical protein